MKIIFRVDGGTNIGMGHIMRALVLARELAKTNEVFFVCRTSKVNKSKYIDGIEKIKQEMFKVIQVSEENLLNELIEIEADMLITDSYDVDEKYFQITKCFFSKTVYIDDMNLYKFDVNFIINQNLGADRFRYNTNKDCRLLLGSNFTMLREEFRDAPQKKINKEVKNILITMGGADPNRVTDYILKSLHNKDYNFHVIIGSAFNSKEDLRTKYENFDNINLYENPIMSEVMGICDVAISSCSSTVYELASIGIPTIGVVTVQNQEAIAEVMNEYGILVNVGWYYDISVRGLIKAFDNITNQFQARKEMVDRQKMHINKKGVFNIVKELLDIY
ncbi:UDP-2,4-diacetamido-2,4,6-trideoxy-beta-L-altropyranose hydrolase [Clostridium sp. UBA4548]|uniref:UDP-2,4-diacetamido-2,4, 6-trideoxy-beta-L-altropyranose hydrolase n=1 Tax=Clostridium sp. UBA4548 TaxID=1946361 RepID=UPI0025C56EB5|nr:UDP-2,4-diacetamido-2,4,6-trideoxy-beta-L-altropyranose hydrolase [Clostridium sp. UBA4548]